MATLFNRGLAMLTRQLKTAGGVTITYTRSGTDYTLTAWRGDERETVDTPGGVVSRLDSKERDYLFLASDLSVGEPARGDRITDDGSVFEVTPIQGNPIWRWSDHQRTIRRVHVKQVS